MEKIIIGGVICYGIGNFLYQWIQKQKLRQQHIDAFLVFLQKSLYAMETGKIRLISYFQEYQSSDTVLMKILKEISNRLSENQYPYGELLWEEVFQEYREQWKCNEEVFLLIVNASHGFFGKSRQENICFLQKSIRELEIQQRKEKEKDAQEQKVWLPVGILGSLMFFIILI